MAAAAKFTRDEAILALDVYYSLADGRVLPDSDEIRDLSLLLNRLPVYPVENRRDDFRNANGIAKQLMLFRSNCKSGKKNRHLGSIFFEVAFEYENRIDELHSIAEAIRRNEKAFNLCFGSPLEDEGFPEGVFLGHLHRIIEKRDGLKYEMKDHCQVCFSSPGLCYKTDENLLQNHLIINPVKTDFSKKYKADDFITVCPTCHRALHSYRPWLTAENCGEVLR
ncbi:MAG: hypothetical protein LUC92_04715 [Clostridiales bacterium]|nr:hypothetical protein [Clostridiales bacterium]